MYRKICKYIITIMSLSLITCWTMIMVFAGQEQEKGQDNNEIVAIVNGQKIDREQLGDFLVNAYGDIALDFLIKKRLVDQEAKKNNVLVTKDEINERLKKNAELQIERMMKQYSLASKEDLELELFKSGMTLDKLRKNIMESFENQIEVQLIVEKILLKDITYTEDELHAAYEEIFGEKIHARQIVLKTRKKAEEVLLKLGGGADFAKLAEKESIDRTSAARGGEMIPFGPNDVLGKAVASLKKGQFSDIIETRYGYHILQVLDRLPGSDKKFDEVHDKLVQRVKIEKLNQKVRPWLRSLFENADVKINM